METTPGVTLATASVSSSSWDFSRIYSRRTISLGGTVIFCIASSILEMVFSRFAIFSSSATVFSCIFWNAAVCFLFWTAKNPTPDAAPTSKTRPPMYIIFLTMGAYFKYYTFYTIMQTKNLQTTFMARHENKKSLCVGK